MNTVGQKKKKISSPLKQINKKKKSKSKSKSKQKVKKFCPKQFLQALIDLQNTNCSTNKKKKSTPRDISSALTIATPALEKTISASKIRSKSSFSQYRKKMSVNVSEPMTINLCAVITEEDNVQYTEKTARSHLNQENYNEEEKKMFLNEKWKRKVNENICAIKIQRAWRNYQTYKMVRTIYLLQKKKQEEKQVNQQHPQNQIHIKIRKPDLEKTLRIKKEQQNKKQERKQQSLLQTQKIIRERYKEPEREIHQGKNSNKESLSSSSRRNQQQEVIQKVKERQSQMLSEVIELIEKERTIKSKDELIKELIKKCENNKKILEKSITEKLEDQSSNQPEEELRINYEAEVFIGQKYKQQSSSSIIENLSQLSQKKQFSDQNNQLIEVDEKLVENASQSSFDMNYDTANEDFKELIIFDQRLKSIKDDKAKKLEFIQDCLLEFRITNTDAIAKKQLVFKKYEQEKKEIQRNRKQFLFSMSKIKKIAIRCHKSSLKQTLSSSKIRKSFSAGNTIIKSVIEDLKIVNIQQQEEEFQFLEKLLGRKNLQISDISKPLNTTPILQLPSPVKIIEELDERPEKNNTNNTEILKQYAEDIQQQIEKQLIDEFVTLVYSQDSLLQYFKPYIEQVYEFKKVQDSEIIQFIENLKEHLPNEESMLERVNQKINPTSTQILRIIRDIDYEIDEYELIIPQESFKKYRSKIEKKYEHENSKTQLSLAEIQAKVKNSYLAQNVFKVEKQKRQRMKKYRNFERDLKIMYMKSVFNCINQFLIENKSSNAYMNGRSSIGPGELTLAIKEYNQFYGLKEYQSLLLQVQKRLTKVINTKCFIPSFKNYHDIQAFQKQVMKQIQIENSENQFKWVNYMDQVLEIWQDLSSSIIQLLIMQASNDIFLIYS